MEIEMNEAVSKDYFNRTLRQAQGVGANLPAV